MAIDCTSFLTQNSSSPCSPHSSGRPKEKPSNKPSVPTLLPEKTSTPYKNFSIKNLSSGKPGKSFLISETQASVPFAKNFINNASIKSSVRLQSKAPKEACS